VKIVDESTGRPREKSRWQGGMHAAVEAKERIYQIKGIKREGVDLEEIKITNEDDIICSITFQVFFGYYPTLAGMSVTKIPPADSCIHEFY